MALPVMNVLSLIATTAVLILVFSGCDYFECRDHTMGMSELMAIEILPARNAPSALVRDTRLKRVTGFDIYVGAESRFTLGVHRDGHELFFDGEWFRTDTGESAPADSLTACAFRTQSSEWICSVTVEDVRHASGNELHLDAARTYLISAASLDDPAPKIILADTARFTSDDTYGVSVFDRPSVARDEVAAIRTQQTRMVSRRSNSPSDEFVIDRIIDATIETIRLDPDSPAELITSGTGVWTSFGRRPWLELSGDGVRVAVEHGGEVWLDGEVVAEGLFPQFAGDRIVLMDDPDRMTRGGLQLYDPATGELRRIVDAPVSFFIPDGEDLYYIVGPDIHRYDISEEKDLPVYSVPEYESARDAIDGFSVLEIKFHSAFRISTGRLIILATVVLDPDNAC